VKKTRTGFTLVELLIALQILAVIATYTIPKILSSTQNTQKSSVFKEVISTESAIFYQQWLLGNIKIGGTVNTSYLLNNTNAVKICSSNAQTQGCWTQALSGNVAGEGGEPGLVLHNGATIIGLRDESMSAPHGYSGFAIDWNGPAGPNTEGDDQIEMQLCWEAVACWGGEVQTGTIGVRPYMTPSYSLYQDIFK
jgi:prepilin-type N-terminal cleavage/methylation domain-containing protein